MKYFTSLVILSFLYIIAYADIPVKVFPNSNHIQKSKPILHGGGVTYVLFSNSINGPFTSPCTLMTNDSLFMKFNCEPYDTITAEYYYDVNENKTIDSTDIIIECDTFIDNYTSNPETKDLEPTTGLIIVYINPENPPSFQVIVRVSDGISSADGILIFQNPQGQFTLSGYVFSNTGEPIVGAMVVLAQSESSIVGDVTDISGFYSLQVDSGTYELFAFDWLGGKHSSFDTTITIVGNTTYNIYLYLFTSYLRGFVRDENENPIANIHVWVSGGYRTVTDANGEYKIMVPPYYGEFGLEQDDLLPNYLVPESQSYIIAENDSIVDNALTNFTCYTANSSITGTVLENGKIPSHKYAIMGWSWQISSYTLAITDNNGNYVLPVHNSLQSFTYNVFLVTWMKEYPLPPGMYPDTSYNEILPGSTANFNLISATCYIRGYVLDEMSNPLANIHVRIGQYVSTFTDSTGQYLATIPPGFGAISIDENYLLPKYMIPQPHYYYVAPHDSIVNDTISNFICYTANAYITGTVTENGAPPTRQYKIFGSSTTLNESYSLTITNQSGYYSLPVHQSKSVQIPYYVTIIFWDSNYPLPEGMYVDTAYYDISPGGIANFNLLPTVEVKEIVDNAPKEFKLYRNYPNPFNPLTTIKYQIPVDCFVKLRVYNVLGEEVKTLVSSEQKVGNYEVIFNADNLPSGVYFYKLEAGTFSDVKTLLLIR